MHPDELNVSLPMVQQLVAEQFPQWRALPIRSIEHMGTVNAIFRIGDQLTARLPLRAETPDGVRQWLQAEADAAHELLGRTRVPTPEPVALGEPGAGHPLPWSVQTWLPGAPATERDADSVLLAHDLAEFIQEVRRIDTRGRTFAGTKRGGDLRTHDAWMQECFHRSSHLLDVPELRRLWLEMRELPRTAPDAMTHSDLIPGNVLVADGRLTGVIDVGGLGPADPALDLVAAWHLLESPARRTLRNALAADDLEWNRGRAWAFEQAMGLVWYYTDTNPAMAALGRRTLQRLTDDTC